MKALALFLCLMASPAAAGKCAGIADALSQLFAGGFHAVNEGQADGGTFTVYVHPDGSFLVLWMDQKQACIVANGMHWSEVKPNA